MPAACCGINTKALANAEAPTNFLVALVRMEVQRTQLPTDGVIFAARTTFSLKCLHEDLPQQITHLLVNLKDKPLQHALVRIKLVLGDAAREDYSRRRERALHRRDPNRPKRGKRTTASS